MPAKDIYHDACVRALVKDGWTITHDPLTVPVDDTDLFIDIGAERLVTAERGSERIAVEVKSFLGLSAVQDLKEAIGQYIIYGIALRQLLTQADRELFLAIRTAVYDTVFQLGVGKMMVKTKSVRLIVFDEETEEIREWI